MKQITSLLLLPAAIFLFIACKKSKDTTPPPDPIATYEFTGNPYNSASSLHHGVVVGTVSLTTDSFNTPQSAYNFTGNGYIKVPHSDILAFPGNEFTLSAWIYPYVTSFAYLLVKGNKLDQIVSYGLDITPGVVHGYIYGSTGELFSAQGTTTIKKNVWQHVVVTAGKTKVTVYYNGKTEGSIVVDRPLLTTDGELTIGAYKGSFPTASFEGKMDQLQIFNKELTPAQVMSLYKNYK